MTNNASIISVICLPIILMIIFYGGMKYYTNRMLIVNDDLFNSSEEEFQAFLNEQGDNIIAYLDGQQIDYTKLDLIHYNVDYNENFTEMYLSKYENYGLFGKTYATHTAPKNWHPQQVDTK